MPGIYMCVGGTMNETAEIVSRQIYLKRNEKYPMPEEGEVRFEKELF
jgi:hypothetical protein